MSKLKILHAESQPLSVAGLKSILINHELSDDVHNVASSEVLELGIIAFEPDLLIIDYNQENIFSLKDIEEVRSSFPKVKILIISDDLNLSRVINVLELGVNGYLTRCSEVNEIIIAVNKIKIGEKYFCSKILDILVNKKNVQHSITKFHEILTEREKEITKQIVLGNTNKKIGEILSISHHTVHTHRKNIMKKLSVKTSTELVFYAINTGLVVLP